MKISGWQIVGLAVIGFGIYRLARGPQTIAGVISEADRRSPYWLLGLGALAFIIGTK